MGWRWLARGARCPKIRRALSAEQLLSCGVMGRTQIAIGMLSLLFVSVALGASPFLDAASDKPVTAQFRGTEWGEGLAEDSPLTARVVTTRLAKTTWGGIFKIEFVILKSKAAKKREIRSRYFIITDERIVLLNEEDNEAAVKKIAALPSAPPFEKADVYGIANGTLAHKEGPWETEIEVKGDLCVYSSGHNSGHFMKLVWKKGAGLIEYSSGYGAHADGYRLQRSK